MCCCCCCCRFCCGAPTTTKEYTHPYSMMHRRLPTARIVVAPPYHQLLVNSYLIPGDLRVNHLILDQRATTAAMRCCSVSRGEYTLILGRVYIT